MSWRQLKESIVGDLQMLLVRAAVCVQVKKVLYFVLMPSAEGVWWGRQTEKEHAERENDQLTWFVRDSPGFGTENLLLDSRALDKLEWSVSLCENSELE